MKRAFSIANPLALALRESGHIWEFGSFRDRVTGVGPVRLPAMTDGGREAAFTVHAFSRDPQDPAAEVLHLVSNGDIKGAEEPLVRVHSGCTTGDVLGSLRCDCGPQLRAAFGIVAGAEGAAVLYIPGQEGRGIGAFAKYVSYIGQEQGLDTFAADRAQELEPESRDYAFAAAVLREMFPAMKRLHLLTNNPEKAEGLAANGIPVATTIALVAGRSPHNARYLETKARHGHGPLKPR